MNEDKIHNKNLYYRFIALWVVCEAFAGGIMHAARIPFTGMIVSSLAVTCIILIAFHIPGKTVIIKATIIVALFKLLLSPHSPPTAYIAVFFQGYLGQLLFFNRRYFKGAAIILSVLALIESAIQRILVLMLLYGNNFWEAVDVFIQKLVGGAEKNYSFFIAIFYILLHAGAGVFIGFFATRLATGSGIWQTDPSLLIDKSLHEPSFTTTQKRNKIKLFFLILWGFVGFLFIQSLADPGNAILPAGIITRILFRSLLIILSWYFIIAPIMMRLIKRTLLSHQSRYQHQANEIMKLIPETKYIFTQSWILSGSKRGIMRIRFFFKILVINILSEKKSAT